MTGYDLTIKLRKARRRHRLTAPTQALYYELVAICNEEEWPDVFKCSNDELCTALKVTEKSLCVYRNELIQAGLLFYKSGQSKKAVGTYSFTKPLSDGCKLFYQSNYLSANQSGDQSDHQPGEKAPDPIKTKKKKETENVLMVVIGGEKKSFDFLKNRFENDEGLQLRWWNSGYKAIPFINGLEYFFQRNHGQAYDELKKLRDHLFNWIPKYAYELENKKPIEKNGKQNNGAAKPAAARGSNGKKGGSISDLQALKQRPGAGTEEGTNAGRSEGSDERADWQEADVIS